MGSSLTGRRGIYSGGGRWASHWALGSGVGADTGRSVVALSAVGGGSVDGGLGCTAQGHPCMGRWPWLHLRFSALVATVLSRLLRGRSGEAMSGLDLGFARDRGAACGSTVDAKASHCRSARAAISGHAMGREAEWHEADSLHCPLGPRARCTVSRAGERHGT